MPRPYGFLAVLLAAAHLGAQPASGEFRVNSYQTGLASYPRVAAGGNGFVIVWRGRDANGYGVLWRTTNVLGAKTADPDFRVSTYQTGYVGEPDVAALPSYGFVIVWEGHDAGASAGVFGQRYDSSGTPAGSRFQINQATPINGRPSVASRPDGSFVVAWEFFGSGPPRTMFRRYDANGAPLSNEYLMPAAATASQAWPSVAAWAGGFVVVWQEGAYPSDDFHGVYGRRFYESGAPADAVFHVNTYTTGRQDYPVVSGKGDGSFVVTWQSAEEGYSIRARRYGPTGIASTEFRVNIHTTNGGSVLPRIAVDASGDYIIAWQAFDPDSVGIFAQRFDESGLRLAGEFRVNATTTGAQAHAAVAASVTNHYHMVTWQSPDANGDGIYARSYCLKGDVNGDTMIDVADVFYLINDLFANGPPSNCPDVNEDGSKDVGDVFYLINYLFASGPAPV